VIPVCQRYDIGLLPFFPLANGLLTGKYRRGGTLPPGTRLGNEPERAAAVMNEDALDRVEALEKVAERNGVTLLQVAIGGLAASPAVTSVIAGATSAAQVEANVAAGDWVPTVAARAAIGAASPSPGQD
jgi:aryl-alcohol dehydrogenase-like predicted oxidoreductase